MWFFGEKQKTKKKEELPPLTEIIADRGLLDLSRDDDVLRFWLPEEGKTALDESTQRLGTVASRYLREFIVIYLYGVHELLRMQAAKTGLYYIPPPLPDPPKPPVSKSPIPKYDACTVRYSRAPSEDWLPGLGKNIVPIKLHLPKVLKDELQVLADKGGIPLSRFVRELLVSHFLGLTFWPRGLRNWSVDQEQIGNEWAEGLREPEGRHPCNDEGGVVSYR